MFGFLKEKLKNAIKGIGDKIIGKKEEKPVLEKILPKKEAEEKKITEKAEERLKKVHEKTKIEEKEEEVKEQLEIEEARKEAEFKETEEEEAKEIEKPAEEIEEVKEVVEEKKGFFQKIKEAVVEKTINDSDFEKIFEPIHMVLLENNVALEVVELIEENLKKDTIGKKVSRQKLAETIRNSIVRSIETVLIEPDIEKFWAKIKEKKPCKIMFIGVNGVGKTLAVAKLANLFQKKGLKCVLAASDTFRAASIEQLQEHADNLNVKMIKHQYGSDAAAVAFDAVKYAEQKNLDVVLIDTAGRQQINVNLMEEMKKIARVSKPDLVIFCADSLTGNDAVEQARKFNEAVAFDYSILNKADVDQKGGAILSVAYITKKPVLFLGTGQEYDKLEFFKKEDIIQKLGL